MRWALHLVLHLHPSIHLHTVAFPLDAPFSLAVCLSVCPVRPAAVPYLCRVSESELRPTPKDGGGLRSPDSQLTAHELVTARHICRDLGGAD